MREEEKKRRRKGRKRRRRRKKRRKNATIFVIVYLTQFVTIAYSHDMVKLFTVQQTSGQGTQQRTERDVVRKSLCEFHIALPMYGEQD